MAITGFSAAAGQVTGVGYNQAGRLATVQYSGSTLESKTYDGFGQRIYATGTDGDRLYTYGPDRTLLEQAEGKTGTVQADYIYVDGQPVAAIEPIVGSTDSKILYLHTNTLGAPQKVTDSSKNIVWAANYMPFGGTDAGAAAIVQNLRLPGQENSDATPFEQNGFRSYANQLGRYIQPDPIGLAGGQNPFAYAGNNPLRFVDPRGLEGGLSGVHNAYGAAKNDVGMFSSAMDYGCWAYGLLDYLFGSASGKEAVAKGYQAQKMCESRGKNIPSNDKAKAFAEQAIMYKQAIGQGDVNAAASTMANTDPTGAITPSNAPMPEIPLGGRVLQWLGWMSQP